MLPLIDIVFLLLIFFIYAMLSMAVHRGIQLDLPESREAEQSENTPVSLYLAKSEDGSLQVLVNESSVAIEDVGSACSSIFQNGDNRQVLLFAEEALDYQSLYRILDELQSAGISEISLQAEME